MSDYEESSEDDGPIRRCCVLRMLPPPDQPLKPVVHTIAPALKDMAATAVAISLWKNANMTMMSVLIKSNENRIRGSNTWKDFVKKVEKLSNKLRIPAPVVAQIHQHISKVGNKITKWATYHFRSVFLYMEKDFVAYYYVSDLIWHSDGTIDYIKTAKNISKSKSPRLSDVDKYRFLCTFCLKEEIEQMLPVLSNIIEEYVEFRNHPLIRYWNCYFSKKLNLIPKDRRLSLDCFMFRHKYVDNWPAKEYFFDRLNPNEQVVNAIWLIDELGIVYQKVLLMKLNESQRIGVYLERCTQIIINCVKNKVNSVDTIMTWSDVRNLIPITPELFVSLVEQLLNAKAPARILMEVWISVDSNIKNHILRHKDYKYIKKILNSFEWSNDFNFVMIVLQDLKADIKTLASKHFFKEFCEKLFSKRENLQWLDRLFDVYSVEDSKKFKQNFVFTSRSIKNLCLEYYSTGNVQDLNDMLTYLLSQSPDHIQEYKSNFLKSKLGTSKCIELLVSDSMIDTLNKIIIDALPTMDLANEFRKDIIFSTSTIQKLRTLLANNDLDKVKEIVDRFLTSDEDKANLKKLLVAEPSQLFFEIILKSDESYLQSLLFWVFGDKNLVKEFKNKASIDDIVDTKLEEIVPIQSDYESTLESTSFEPLNRFLNWYFESPSKVKKYKLQRIHSYSSIRAISSLSRKRRHVEHLKTTMEWFFENDKSEIEKFNNIHKKCKIATILSD